MNCVFIKVGSSPWHRPASLGPVMEIDCNLTKRLWALQTVHMPRLGFVGRLPSWSLGCANAEECRLGIPTSSSPLFPPLYSSVSFHSLINHPVCVLIHLHPRSPLLIAPSPSFSVLLLWSMSDSPFAGFGVIQESTQTYSTSSSSGFASPGFLFGVFWKGIHLLLSVYLW